MTMTKTLMIVAESTVVTWLLLVAASLIRARAWTPAGLMVAFGNRENMGEPSAFAGRCERAARNMLENLVLFAALALTASIAGITDPQVELGARVFFWARIVYIPIYLAGIPFLRTLTWLVGVIGMAMIFGAILQAMAHAA